MWCSLVTGWPRSPAIVVSALTQLYAANPWAVYYYYIYPGQVLAIPGGYDGGTTTPVMAVARLRLLWELLRGLPRGHVKRHRPVLRGIRLFTAPAE